MLGKTVRNKCRHVRFLQVIPSSVWGGCILVVLRQLDDAGVQAALHPREEPRSLLSEARVLLRARPTVGSSAASNVPPGERCTYHTHRRAHPRTGGEGAW